MTVLQIFAQVLFWAGNQSNHQNFDPSNLPYEFGLIFIGMKQTKNKKNMADSKKLSFSIFMKILKIGPWISIIG